MPRRTGHSCIRVFIWVIGAGLLLCLVLAGISALINRSLPARPALVDRLSVVDKARAAELLNLRQARGDRVMPGWAAADIPLILYNEEYAFLIGLPDPPDGWTTIPQGAQRGTAWEAVPGDDFLGQVYYRQSLSDGVTPQAFTVRVGEHWVASMMTMGAMKIELVGQFRRSLPAPVSVVFPYSLVVDQFIPGSDFYGATVLHEAMHAYQGISIGERLASAERANIQWADRYPWDDESLQADWQTELNLLNKALRSKEDSEVLELARQFLQNRTQRRKAAGLSADMIEFEQQREWAEGIAKYAELAIYRQGASENYLPILDQQQDAEFHSYRGFQKHWNREVSQIRLMADDEGDGRFYYTGWAQAVILERLMPGWETRIFQDGVWLEDLVAEAVR